MLFLSETVLSPSLAGGSPYPFDPSHPPPTLPTLCSLSCADLAVARGVSR